MKFLKSFLAICLIVCLTSCAALQPSGKTNPITLASAIISGAEILVQVIPATAPYANVVDTWLNGGMNILTDFASGPVTTASLAKADSDMKTFIATQPTALPQNVQNIINGVLTAAQAFINGTQAQLSPVNGQVPVATPAFAKAANAPTVSPHVSKEAKNLLDRIKIVQAKIGH